MKKHIRIAVLAVFLIPSSLFATTWESSLEQAKVWQAVAISEDGSKIFAAAYNGNIFTSTDGGTNWTEVSDTTHEWQDISISDDGSIGVAAATHDGDVYVSKDGGTTWSLSSAGQRSWTSVASSDDGDVVVAAANDGTIHISRDRGDTWSVSTTTAVDATAPVPFVFVDISDDGQKLIAVAYPTGSVLTSVDGGDTWNTHDTLGEAKWTSVSISGDGDTSLAARADGTIFVSTDGASWQEKTKLAGEVWWAKTLNNNENVFVGMILGSVYRSTDGGGTWSDVSINSKTWLDIAATDGGRKIVGATYEDFVYIYAEEAPVVEPEPKEETPPVVTAPEPEKKKRRRGGGSGRIVRKAVEQTPVVPAVAAVVVAPTPVVAYAAPVRNTPQRDLDVAMSGEDVKKLQEVLITQKVGENTQNLAAVGATGYFGDITRNALAEFQKKVGLPAYGYFGEKTKAAFKALGIVWW